VLEYFEGTLFLTTNRAETIDSAFRSRIHLSVSYPALSGDALRTLWRSWIIRGCSERRPRWLTEKFLERLAKTEVNGRDIKNIVSMARALARNGKREMTAADILQGLEAMEVFETDFNEQLAKRKHGKKT
jgi:hypothetical protein